MATPDDAGQTTGEKPPNNITIAMLSAVLCCLPIGIYAIYLSIQSDIAWATGDAQKAAERGKQAKQTALYGIPAVGVLLIIVYLLYGVAGDMGVDLGGSSYE